MAARTEAGDLTEHLMHERANRQTNSESGSFKLPGSP